MCFSISFGKSSEKTILLTVLIEWIFFFFFDTQEKSEKTAKKYAQKKERKKAKWKMTNSSIVFFAVSFHLCVVFCFCCCFLYHLAAHIVSAHNHRINIASVQMIRIYTNTITLTAQLWQHFILPLKNAGHLPNTGKEREREEKIVFTEHKNNRKNWA